MLRRRVPNTTLQRSVAAPAAFEEFYRAHAEALLVFLTRRTLDAHLALDLTAETFAKAFTQRKRFRGSTEAEAAAWLYSIARNEHLQYVRRGKVERCATARLGLIGPTFSATDLERVETLASLGPLREAVRLCFEDLPPGQRDAVRLRIIDELPYSHVALRLGVSEPTARARVSRGVRELRARMATTTGELSWMTD
ncbi:MAG TPA: RNA polymerase sigma factor [Solirubrobacteraceae bacterium]|nr:RNA polymerase sigma factor [Solirubrobacteraceae bacterium]